MLVLTRKKGQCIQIDDNVRVWIREIRPNMVSVAIDAPKGVSIVRAELLEQSADASEAGAVA